MGISKITKSTLISQPRENVFRFINSRTNVPDPVDSTGVRKFVYSREPNHKERGFAGYPYIIVRDPTLLQSAHSINRSQAMMEWEQEIEVRASDDMPNSAHTGRGLQFLNDIADDIVAFFGSSNGRSDLRKYGHFNLVLNVDRTESILVDTEDVFRAIVRITYQMRLAV